MRKAIAFALTLLVVGLACIAQQPSAQLTMTGVGGGFGGSGGFSPSCSQSTNWLARASSVTLTADKTNYDNLLCGLETDGIGCSNTVDALYIYMAVDVATAKLNLCSASFPIVSHGTNVDTSGFAQYVGFTGNASDRYLDTGFGPATAAGFYTQNNASFGTCISTTNSGSLTEMGQGTGSVFESRLIPSFGGSFAVVEINTGSQDLINPNTSVAGLWHLSRTGVTTVVYYLSGTSLSSTSTASSAFGSNPFFILAENQGGTPINFTSNQHLGSFIGKGMNGTQVTNFRNRMNTFAGAYSKSC